MDVQFRTAVLARLESDPTFTMDLPREVAHAFRKRIAVIRAARDERDLYALKSARFKKLEGARAHERSMRLNDQWRLILEIHPGSPRNVVEVCKVEDYH